MIACYLCLLFMIACYDPNNWYSIHDSYTIATSQMGQSVDLVTKYTDSDSKQTPEVLRQRYVRFPYGSD